MEGLCVKVSFWVSHRYQQLPLLRNQGRTLTTSWWAGISDSRQNSRNAACMSCSRTSAGNFQVERRNCTMLLSGDDTEATRAELRRCVLSEIPQFPSSHYRFPYTTRQGTWDAEVCFFETRILHLPGCWHVNETTSLDVSTCLSSTGFWSGWQPDLRSVRIANIVF